MKRVKTAVLVALVAMAVVGLALPAGAHITYFSHTFVSVQCNDPSCDTFTAGYVEGEIACTAGESWLVTARVSQKNEDGSLAYIGRGRDKGWCTGSTQTWRAPITDESGFLTCDEPFEVRSIARTRAGTTLHDKRTQAVQVAWPC